MSLASSLVAPTAIHQSHRDNTDHARLVCCRRHSPKRWSWAGRRSLVDGELLAQGQVLEGELAVAADEEGQESKQVEYEGDHERRLWPDEACGSLTCWANGVLASHRTQRNPADAQDRDGFAAARPSSSRPLDSK
jgi:hypothetical protein